MQNMRSDPLNTFETAELLETWRDVLDDSDLRTQITLKGLTTVSVNLETGAVTRTADSDTVNAVRRVVSVDEVARAGGLLEINDRVYILEQADITGELQSVDAVVEGTEVLTVIKFEADPLNWVWQLWARLA